MKFPTLAAEELAARYLESNLARTSARKRPIPTSAGPLALFTTDGLRAKLSERCAIPRLPGSYPLVAPGEDTTTESSLRPPLEWPGWRLALSVDDRKVFDTEADRRVARYFIIGSVVIAAMAVLGVFIARGFGRQVRWRG